jgi:hypothetical protein
VNLTDLTRQIGALRGQPAAEAARVLTDLAADLATLATDERISDDSATNLLVRALRAIRPRADRPTDRRAALDQLRQALAEGPREPGRPALGSPRTVRAPDEVWAGVDAYAARHGISESRAAAELLAAGIAAEE